VGDFQLRHRDLFLDQTTIRGIKAFITSGAASLRAGGAIRIAGDEGLTLIPKNLSQRLGMAHPP
jgi:hypothetical protein